jgi:arginyl-tRNA synthetase
MIRQRIERALTELLGTLPEGHEVEFVKDPKMGDIASNVAFLLAKERGQIPGAIAQELADQLNGIPEFRQVIVGGRGFLNFAISDYWLTAGILLAGQPDFGRSDSGAGRRVLVEFISANPTGPLNVVNARAGAYGSALVSLLRHTGHQADAEFYVNDSGNQIALLSQSVAARVAEQKGEPWAIPDGGYPGEYLKPIAAEALRQGIEPSRWGSFAVDRMLEGQRQTLERFRAHFDSFVRESSIRPTNAEIVQRLAERGLSYEKDGATWFRAKDFGDTEDRVFVKSDGEPAYALTDLNYHRRKFERGYDWLITIWGPDHHGDIARLKGGLKSLGYPAEKLDIPIVQWTTLLREGKKLGMSKRSGEYITIDEVLDEIGVDALKFYLLMRRSSQQLEFDLALAKQTSPENPVYYAQYGHARIASILRFAREKGHDPDARPVEYAFTDDGERSLAKFLMRYPDVVESAAGNLEPHRLVYYVLDLANAFHLFYENVRVVSDDPTATTFRMYLCQCAKQVLRNALGLVGVSAPEKM